LAFTLVGLMACSDETTGSPGSTDSGVTSDQASGSPDAAGRDATSGGPDANHAGSDATSDTGTYATSSGTDGAGPAQDAGAGSDVGPDASGPVPEAGLDSGVTGPYAWKNAQVVGGGYVPSVVFNPKEKDLIYLRTDMGGIP
jgi:hypothetical protein